MRRHLALASVAAAALTLSLGPATALAQGPASAAIAEADRLDEEAGRLYREGKLAEAVAVASKEAALTEKELGSNDPPTAAAHATLGGLYVEQGDYLRAEPLLRDAVDVLEKADGARDRDRAGALDNLAVLYS